MANSIADCAVLNNGVEMPWLGFGVFLSPPGSTTYDSVRVALDVGYRHIDTAMIYENEQDVGKAIKDSRVPREEIFVTTKVWNDDMRSNNTLKAFDRSRKLLDIDMIDLYLVHWPVQGKYIDTYKVLEGLYRDGKVRAIGVSNFLVHHLQDLLSRVDVNPVINQVEWHPWLQLPDLYQYTRENKIQLEAWAPLIQGQGAQVPLFKEIGAKYGKSWAQVMIRWDLQREVVTIPKSNTPSRIKENSQVFDFELSAEDMAAINALDEGKRVAADPDNFDF
jgi:diketogulonate reductase-like aldo/keto reductase